MKRVIPLIFVYSIFYFAGCISSEDKNDPKILLSAFFNALSAKNFYQAKKYVTADSEGMLNMAQAVMQEIPDSTQQLIFETKNLYLGNATINGDYATMPVKNRNSNDTIYFSLRQENGQWKVSMNISTVLQMARHKPVIPPMSDSLENLNSGMKPGIHSMTKDEMKEARKKIDSANNHLSNAK